MHGLQNIKRIYIQWVTVQQLLFGMVMLSAKQHSVFGTQSRELNEYEGVSVCLQRTACWIKPTEIAWPEPRNRNITNPPFHDIYKLSQTIFDYYSILYLLSETSVKVNQKKETARKRARVWDETVCFSEGTWYRTELKCCQVRFEPHTLHGRTPERDNTAILSLLRTKLSHGDKATTEGSRRRLPPESHCDWLLHFPAKYEIHDNGNDDKYVKLVLQDAGLIPRCSN